MKNFKKMNKDFILIYDNGWCVFILQQFISGFYSFRFKLELRIKIKLPTTPTIIQFKINSLRSWYRSANNGSLSVCCYFIIIQPSHHVWFPPPFTTRHYISCWYHTPIYKFSNNTSGIITALAINYKQEEENIK